MRRGGFATLGFDLAERRERGLWRERQVFESMAGTRAVVAGREALVFSSNDYLGLAGDQRIVDALSEGATRYGVGGRASHLVSGHTRAHQQLEEELAAFTGRESALLFSSGYAANLGVLNALLGKGDAVFEDRLNHASLLDGGLSSGARFRRFLHADVQSLEARLRQSTARRKLVAVDGVFSMDGDEAPLAELAACCQRHEAWLYVDDAHGFGVLGEHGGGSLQKQALDQTRVPLLMATLGKALGCAGAFVAGSREAVDALIQFARTYIYTTALPPALALAASAALSIVREEGWRREQLQRLVARLRHGLRERGYTVLPSQTPIQPVIIGEAHAAVALSQRLLERGFWVPAIRPPTVAEGTARLRIALSAAHSETEVDSLLDAMADVRGTGLDA